MWKKLIEKRELIGIMDYCLCYYYPNINKIIAVKYGELPIEINKVNDFRYEGHMIKKLKPFTLNYSYYLDGIKIFNEDWIKYSTDKTLKNDQETYKAVLVYISKIKRKNKVSILQESF